MALYVVFIAVHYGGITDTIYRCFQLLLVTGTGTLVWSNRTMVQWLLSMLLDMVAPSSQSAVRFITPPIRRMQYR